MQKAGFLTARLKSKLAEFLSMPVLRSAIFNVIEYVCFSSLELFDIRAYVRLNMEKGCNIIGKSEDAEDIGTIERSI